MKSKLILLAGLIALVTAGCSTSEQLAKNLNSKHLAGDGFVSIHQIGFDEETQTPEMKSVIVSGNFQTIKADSNYLHYLNESSAAWYNADNKTQRISLTITAKDKDEFNEILAKVSQIPDHVLSTK